MRPQPDHLTDNYACDVSTNDREAYFGEQLRDTTVTTTT